MRHTRTFACAAALLIALCSHSFAQPCSQATVRGTWGWQGHGTAMVKVPGSATPMPVPLVSLGTLNVDSQGGYTAHGTASLGGQILDADWTGSIKVNPDCTAADTYNYLSVEAADRFVILDNGNEMRSMPTKFPTGPVAITYSFRRISWGEAHCTSDMARGVYGGAIEGTYMIPVPGQPQRVPTAFSAISTQNFQHGGTGTAVNTASLGGTLFDVEFPQLSMQANPDCTATMVYTDATSKQFPGLTFSGTVKYIVLNHGDELLGMDIESNVGLPITLLNYKRISRIPVGPDR